MYITNSSYRLLEKEWTYLIVWPINNFIFSISGSDSDSDSDGNSDSESDNDSDSTNLMGGQITMDYEKLTLDKGKPTLVDKKLTLKVKRRKNHWIITKKI